MSQEGARAQRYHEAAAAEFRPEEDRLHLSKKTDMLFMLLAAGLAVAVVLTDLLLMVLVQD